MHCSYFTEERCRSCSLMEQPYEAQLAGKQRHAELALGDRPGLTWLPPVTSVEQGFRNKAKLVVGGTVAAPTLGILDVEARGVDLQGCGLYVPALHASFPALAELVTRAGLTPYDVPTRRGELKHLVVTASPDGELLVRFVLRSQEPVARIRKHLPSLLAALPHVRVVSVNLQPAHAAVLEGEREIVLTEQQTLRMRVNGIDMHLRPQSFFQTNTDVAGALYRQAREWVAEAGPASVWDLYCGVGGFALHCAGTTAGTVGPRRVTGIETSREAVASAEQSADEAGLTTVSFAADDATAFALRSPAPDLVIVNPPRRGLGDTLSGWLERSSVQRVIYSSCHSGSMARDLATMPSLRPTRARLLDMFPQTSHYELVALLERA